VRAILLIALATALLGLFVPLLRLAELTSLTMLLIFATVNLSLFLIGRRDGAPEKLRRWRYWGLFGAAVSLGLVASEIAGRH
jgi:basic amino acid/polyamine antiporter, APA family